MKRVLLIEISSKLQLVLHYLCYPRVSVCDILHVNRLFLGF